MMALEARTGVQLKDFVLQRIPPMDFSTLTFTLTYAALVSFLIYTINKPRLFILWMQAYCLLIIMRTLAIFFVSLEPPAGMILLQDPVTILFMSRPGGGYIVKDLFFSGHISAIVLFILVASNRKVKWFLGILAISVSILLLVQHVHYTIDIIAAPLFSLLAYKGSRFINRLVNIKTQMIPVPVELNPNGKLQGRERAS